ncbi:MAG: N-acetylmuramoyl-L-alanine amidase [Alphaproteobacteria bacterium]|nr:N-acetylmuramoyl-L-alanine amidase [Alphaproteobacteria bacterium]
MTPPALTLLERPSPNFDARTRPVDLVVLHYTGMQDAETALARLTDPAPKAGRYPGPWQPAETPPDQDLGRVSAHYVVAEDGRVFRLVDEAQRAWHAGVARWDGESDVNARSIGIEIVNGGHDFGLPPFADAQIAAVEALLADILGRHRLGPHRVVGHSDVAPERKLDPGEHFPWARLAARGLALWPLSRPAEGGAVVTQGDVVVAVQEALCAFGYGAPVTGEVDAATQAVLAAFQRRFRTRRIDGRLDEETAAILADVGAQAATLRIARLRS